jgi:hypothetical protein
VTYGELRVTSAPEGAQVLLALGRAPVVARDLPIGVAHELVALAEGRAPTRTVVPADAAWQKQAVSASLELQIELPELAAGAAVDLGPTHLPKAIGAPTGPVGALHVTTVPTGAQVYQLVGFTPSARIENLKTSELAELLLYASGHELARVQVSEQSFIEEDGKRVANLHVELTPLAAAARP